MNANQIESDTIPAGEELKIIKQMIDNTRTVTANSWIFLLLWGWLGFANCILTYILIYIEQYAYISQLWTISVIIGFIVSFVIGIKMGRKKRIVSYTDHAVSNLWMACGIAFFLLGVVAPNVGILDKDNIAPVLSVIGGVGIFVTGQIIDWNVLRISGVLWWLAAVLMMFTHPHLHTLILGVVIIPGYLIPGYLLRKEFKNSK